MTHDPSYRRILHKMGYYDYQQGLIYHNLYQEDGWNSHQQNCRNFILKAIELYWPEKITVLGSGWLLDLPLAEMAEKTGKVILIDIIHPPEVISQTSGMKNVQLIEQDITGGLIEEVWKKAGKRTILNRLSSLGEIIIPEYQPVEDPGLVISLNILTQLESQPERLLKKKSRATEAEFRHFRGEVQNKHLGFLKKHRSALITDVAELITDNNGKTSEKETLATAIPEGKMKEEWIWDFDLLRSDFNKKSSVYKICALIL
jgi:hypothetical protein